ncbi:MAG: hypothetical protein U5P41_09360 [Gammaproteobacteria bacterium]|nr:hypothetical protein [Gammaproteobacteria bacterium]
MMPAKKTTTLALIGCGLWGRNILRDLIDLDCRVIVVDPDLTQRAKAESLGAIQTLERIDSLPDVDGLVVAAPATTHY